MIAGYVRAMDVLHRACLIVAGVSLVIITLIVPWGVFTRYVLNSASSWPEPLAVLLMVVLAFSSAIVCYREYLHIGVGLFPSMLSPRGQAMLGVVLEAAMLATNLFMLVYGITLVQTTWYQSVAEFPAVSVGVAYLPIPIAGGITILFIIERFLTRAFFREQDLETIQSTATE